MELEPGDDTAVSYVAIYSLFSTTVAFVSMIAAGKHASFGNHLRQAGAGALAATFAGSCVGMAGAYMLTRLVRVHNPGKVTAALNSAVTIATFLVGALLYDKASMRGAAGAVLCAGGMYLMKTPAS